MDRPAPAPRVSRRWVAAILGGLLLVAAAAATPTLLRWVRAERAVDSTGLRFGTVTRGDLVRDLSVQGRVVAGLSPTLFSPGPGIVSLRVRAGAPVSRGDVLAIIDSPELQSYLAQARAEQMTSRAALDRQRILSRQAQLRARQQVELLIVRLEAAKRQLERVEQMFGEGLTSQTDHETARDSVRVAKLELEQARKELGFSEESEGFEVATRQQQVLRQDSIVAELQKRVEGLTIRAPFDGMMASIAVQDRDAVTTHQPILNVVNLSSLELEIGLPEEYGSETGIGTPATIAFLGKDHEGRVTAVSPEVVNGELAARVDFAGPPPEGLRQNQRLTVRLTFESRRNVLKAPRGAFLESEGSRAAYVVDGRVARRREIAIGARSVGEVEVLKGLNVGEKIVVSDTSTFGSASNVLLR